MLHVVHCAQIGIRPCTAKTGICLELAHEQQHPASLCTVMDVALPGGRVFGGGALALPVEQALVDGIILVHGGGSLTDEDKIAFMDEIQSLYLDSKRRAKKFTPKKYLKNQEEK